MYCGRLEKGGDCPVAEAASRYVGSVRKACVFTGAFAGVVSGAAVVIFSALNTDARVQMVSEDAEECVIFLARCVGLAALGGAVAGWAIANRILFC
jgi:hypothetical protein